MNQISYEELYEKALFYKQQMEEGLARISIYEDVMFEKLYTKIDRRYCSCIANVLLHKGYDAVYPSIEYALINNNIQNETEESVYNINRIIGKQIIAEKLENNFDKMWILTSIYEKIKEVDKIIIEDGKKVSFDEFVGKFTSIHEKYNNEYFIVIKTKSIIYHTEEVEINNYIFNRERDGELFTANIDNMDENTIIFEIIPKNI